MRFCMSSDRLIIKDDFFKDEMSVKEFNIDPLCISFSRIPISKKV